MIKVYWYDATQTILMLDYPQAMTSQASSDKAFEEMTSMVQAVGKPVYIVFHFPPKYTVPLGYIAKSKHYFGWLYHHSEHIHEAIFVHQSQLLIKIGNALGSLSPNMDKTAAQKFVHMPNLALALKRIQNQQSTT